jgi:hypothetical protein
MHISFKIIKCISLYVAQHVSDTTVPNTGLEDATETTPHGDQRLHLQ